MSNWFWDSQGNDIRRIHRSAVAIDDELIALPMAHTQRSYFGDMFAGTLFGIALIVRR